MLLLQQQSDSVVQESGSIMSRVFSSAHGTIIMNGLTKLSKSSRSVARLLQPQLFRKFTELKMFSVCLLKNITTPKQSLYKMKVGEGIYCCTSHFLIKFCLLKGIPEFVSFNAPNRFALNDASIKWRPCLEAKSNIRPPHNGLEAAV